MNRGQKKKAHKKRYGHNPPTKDFIYREYGVDMAVVAETLRKAFIAAKEIVEAVVKNITTAWEKMKESIQTMSEEEYAEFLEELPPETRGWAATIRAAGRESGKEI